MTRDEAIEAAAKALYEHTREDGYDGAEWDWPNIDRSYDYDGDEDEPHGPEWLRDRIRASASVVAAALVPVLLNDLADRIDEGIDSYAYTTSDCEDMAAAQNNAVERASALVRAAAEGWGA